YFWPLAELNPLLHTWSLAVEEQFYLVFPIVLVVAMALGVRRRSAGLMSARGVALIAVLGLSFMSALVVMGSLGGVSVARGLVGFYSPFPRLWEFGAGATLALVPHAGWFRNRASAALAGIAGALMLVGALFLIDGSTAWPGPWMLLPVAGTMLVIMCGSSAEHTTPVQQALSLPAMVRI